MTFKKKIITVILLSQIICLPLGYLAVLNVKYTSDSFTKVDSIYKQIELLNTITSYLADFERGQKGYMLIGDEIYLEPYSSAEAKFNDTVEILIQSTPDLFIKNSLKEIIQIKDEWIQKSSIPQMMAKKKLTRGLITTDDFIKILTSFNDKEIFGRIHTILAELKNKQTALYQNLSNEALRTSTRSIIMTMISIAAFILSLIVLIWLSSRATDHVAHLIQNLSDILFSSKEKVSELNNVTIEMQKAAEDQVSAIQTTSSATTQISATIDTTTKNINNSLKLTINGEGFAQDGAKVGHELSAKLIEMRNSLSDNLDSIAIGFTAVEKFSIRIQEIKGMTKLINDIVFQTKLLSFNASVEAARAGEAGKGFSVVAEEVGRLAKMSGDSAKQIEDTLSSAAVDINSIAENNKKTLHDIKNNITNSTDEILNFSESNLMAFTKIVKVSGEIKQQIEHILQSSQEQTSGIKNIEENMIQLSSVSDITKYSTSHTHKIVQQLNDAMSSLNSAAGSISNEFISMDRVNMKTSDSLKEVPLKSNKSNRLVA